MALSPSALKAQRAARPWDRLFLSGFFVSAFVLALSAGSWAQDPKDPMELFKLFDENGDGVIDETEFRIKKIRIFNMFDTNENDAIDAGEVRISEEKLAAADIDKSGTVDSIEFDAMGLGEFSAADTNGDGKVTPEEFVRFVENIRGQT